MAEYIEREAAIKKMQELKRYAWAHPNRAEYRSTLDVDDVLFGLHYLPAADVAPVVHGRWEYHDCVCTGDGLAAVYACSNCRFCIYEEVFEQLNATDFCNCCGARMDGAG